MIEARPARAAVVAGAVEPLVVRAGQHPDRSELPRLREGALREVRVEPHAFPLSEAEPSGFLPDRVRHADAAEVVRERGAPNERHGGCRQSEPPGGGLREIGNTRRVLAQPRRLETGECGDRHEGGVDLLASDPELRERLDLERLLPHPRLVQLGEELVEVPLARARRAEARTRRPLDVRSTARASSGPEAERKREMSRATCRRRIGNGIASPRASGNPRPSQRAKTYSSAASMLEPRSSHPANRCATSHIVANAVARPRAGVGDRVLDQRGADLRGRPAPT